MRYLPRVTGRRFPGSHADKSRDVQVAKGSHDESRVGSCGMFPQSRGLGVTGL